jgi:hypothetical protein
MKQLIFCLCLVLLLCAGCQKEDPATTEPAVTTTLTPPFIPTELLGSWVSATGGELEMVETITSGEDGTMSVSAVYQGRDAGTIYGTYLVAGHSIYCNITEGTTPFSVEYDFRIDGRELTLTDADGPAHYLRVS